MNLSRTGPLRPELGWFPLAVNRDGSRFSGTAEQAPFRINVLGFRWLGLVLVLRREPVLRDPGGRAVIPPAIDRHGLILAEIRAVQLRMLREIGGMLAHPDVDKVLTQEQRDILAEHVEQARRQADISKADARAFALAGADDLRLGWCEARQSHTFLPAGEGPG